MFVSIQGCTRVYELYKDRIEHVVLDSARRIMSIEGDGEWGNESGESCSEALKYL